MPDRRIEECVLCDTPMDTDRVSSRGDSRFYTCEICGELHISHISFLEQQYRNYPRHLISGYTRELKETSKPPVMLSAENIQRILDSPDVPRNVLGKLNKLLLHLERKSR